MFVELFCFQVYLFSVNLQSEDAKLFVLPFEVEVCHLRSKSKYSALRSHSTFHEYKQSMFNTTDANIFILAAFGIWHLCNTFGT